MASFFSFRARDATAVAIHATWGSFWIAFGILFALIAVGIVPAPALPFGSAVMPALAMWFVVLCSITMMGALSALTDNLGVAGVLWTLAAGSGLTAAGLWPTRPISYPGGLPGAKVGQ